MRLIGVAALIVLATVTAGCLGGPQSSVNAPPVNVTQGETTKFTVTAEKVKVITSKKAGGDNVIIRANESSADPPADYFEANVANYIWRWESIQDRITLTLSVTATNNSRVGERTYSFAGYREFSGHSSSIIGNGTVRVRED